MFELPRDTRRAQKLFLIPEHAVAAAYSSRAPVPALIAKAEADLRPEGVS